MTSARITDPTHKVWDITGKTVLVLGAKGLVGSALIRRLSQDNCKVFAATRAEADFIDARSTLALFERVKPDAVILAAAKVGGILANRDNPVSFLEDNLLIQLNALRAAHTVDVDRFLLLGSSCIYPKFAAQPIAETSLMTGPLEPTNDAYAIAKIAGIRLVDAYRQQYGRRWISAMPTNLYGPNDNFDLTTGHVLPALLRKFHEAKAAGAPSVEIWGSGTARREFMHVDDCADALVFCLQTYDAAGPVNIGSGVDISINDLAHIIQDRVGFEGPLKRDLSKPDGTPAKLMDNSRLLAAGWQPKRDLKTGISQTYEWYLNSLAST